MQNQLQMDVERVKAAVKNRKKRSLQHTLTKRTSRLLTPRRREDWTPIYTVPSEAELFHANQCFFGRNLLTPPWKGKIRFLNIFTEWNGVPVPTWISNILYSCDRSLTEWRDLIQNYKHLSLAFPFVRAGICTLDAMVNKHLQIRTCVRKFVQNVRTRIARRRVIGEVDLYTTTAIPRGAQVRVYDFPSKGVYIFHTQTAIRIILSALQHSMYGIPTPYMPKNPYTNLPFSCAQLMVIMEQILVNCARAHHTPPVRIFQFRKSCYDIVRFKTTYRHSLNMESARALLHSFHDPTSTEFYMEVLDDTFEIENISAPRWNLLRTYVRRRTVPTEILKKFDTVVLSLFLYQNHSLCYTFATYDAMLNELELAYIATLEWWKHTPRQILQRIGSNAFRTTTAGSGAASAPQSNSQILEHV